MRWKVYLVLLIIVGGGIWFFRPGIEKSLRKTNISLQGMGDPAQFLGFVHRGDLAAVTEYLKAGMSPDTVYMNEAVLFSALYEGHFQIAGALLEAGADPNIRDKQGRTPLIVASSKGRDPDGSFQFVGLLLKKGVDKEQVDEKGLTALDYAWNTGNTQVALLLEGEKGPPSDDPPTGYAMDGYSRAQELILEISETQSQKKFAELVRLGEDGVMCVVDGLSDEDQRIRKMSMTLLPRMGKIPAEYRGPIQDGYDESIGTDREYFAKGLVNTAQGPEEKVEILISLLEDDDWQILHFTLTTLGNMGRKAKPAFPALEALKERKPRMRRRIVGVMDKING